MGRGEPAAAIVAAGVVAWAVWRQGTVSTAVGLALVVAAVRRVGFAVVVTSLCVVAVVRSDAAERSLAPRQLGPFAGWATVEVDPATARGGTRAVIEIDGERFEIWERGRAHQLRVARWQTGDRVWLSGERRPLGDSRASRVAWQHVVGVVDVTWYGDRVAGQRLYVAANRVRDLVHRGTSSLPDARAALARGLVIGDDRDQPADMVERFRASGLSHLTAVSGQNIALVVAAAGPALRRLRPAPRLVSTVGLIAWFVVLTRAEPSVLRAGVMAGLGAVAFALGREREPPRLLALAVIGLLLVDPLLARSVGFWLSVGATAGVTMLAPMLTRWLRPLGRLAMPAAVTLGAQIGVAAPSVVVFGRLSLVGTLANLVAVPVAGLVMLYGLPASMVAGAVSPVRGVVMLPVDAGVRWVDAVATLAARLSPAGTANVAGWALVVIGVWFVARHRSDSDGDLPH